jgi:SnoaL-like polyketide cyclase
MKRLSPRALGLGLACSLAASGLALTSAKAESAKSPSYLNAPSYACGPKAGHSDWYAKGVPYPCVRGVPIASSAGRELYHDFMEKAWVQGDLSVLDKYVDPNSYDYSPLHGPEKGTKGFAGIITSMRASLSGVTLVHSDMEEGNLITHFWKLCGKHDKAPLFGVPANGKTVCLVGISTVEVKNNATKVGARWSVLDLYGLFIQLGVIKPPA